MSTYLLDAHAGVLRPVWTDMESIGFLALYLDAHDTSPAEAQLTRGYWRSAGVDAYPFEVEHFALEDEADGTLTLKSLRYADDPPYGEVSRVTAADGSLVVMFDAAMTAVIRNGKLAWLARLD